MATDMGNEIGRQNGMLDTIQGKVGKMNDGFVQKIIRCICTFPQTASADVRIESANKRTEKLLR
jgi:hypothetical protein